MAFPASVDSFGSDVVDLTDKVMANHVNNLRSAVTSIENTIGVGTSGTISNVLSSTWPTTQGSTSTTTWSSLTARIANLENAAKNGMATNPPYLLTTGGTVTATTGVAITAKGYSTSNILESRTSANVLGFYVNSSGLPQVDVSSVAKEVLYVGSTAYNNLNNTLTQVNAGILGAAPFNIMMLSGM